MIRLHKIVREKRLFKINTTCSSTYLSDLLIVIMNGGSIGNCLLFDTKVDVFLAEGS